MLWTVTLPFLFIGGVMFLATVMIVARYSSHRNIWHFGPQMKPEDAELVLPTVIHGPDDFRSWDVDHDLSLISW